MKCEVSTKLKHKGQDQLPNRQYVNMHEGAKRFISLICLTGNQSIRHHHMHSSLVHLLLLGVPLWQNAPTTKATLQTARFVAPSRICMQGEAVRWV